MCWFKKFNKSEKKKKTKTCLVDLYIMMHHSPKGTNSSWNYEQKTQKVVVSQNKIHTSHFFEKEISVDVRRRQTGGGKQETKMQISMSMFLASHCLSDEYIVTFQFRTLETF